MNDALIIRALSVVPKNGVAGVMGRFARLALPRAFHRALLRWYVGHYRVNLDECVGGIDDFPSLSEFFVRALKPGVRPVDPAPDAVVSPVDARVYAFGTVEQGSFEQSPGRKASLAELLGGDAAAYEGGSYAVLYLSPKDYHRVHVPKEGTLVAARYRPGKLWPVFPAATRLVDELFGRNERLVFFFDTDAGRVALVMIGAFGVGRMTSPHTSVVTNTGAPSREDALAVSLGRADELGRFCMGSTVILVFEPGRIAWELEVDAPVRLGRRIARRAG